MILGTAKPGSFWRSIWLFRARCRDQLFGQVGPREEIVHQVVLPKQMAARCFSTKLVTCLPQFKHGYYASCRTTALAGGSQKAGRGTFEVAASTNQNLYHLMHRLFLEDLFYRLNVVPLKLPPLRERVRILDR